MKAIVISQPGGPEVLQLAERPVPVPTHGEVRIRVHAAGVNRPDVAQREGRYPAPEGSPQDILGLEVSGIIDAIGEGVDRWQVGDRVCALLAGGGYAEYVTVSAMQCLPIPDGLSFGDAASLPETFFTVWSNVFDRAGFRAGDTFLVHGGTSGIGVAAIQMVWAMGGRVYTTAGSEEKCAFAEKLGAVKAVNYREQDFFQEIKALEPGGLNIILDMIGGDYTQKNLDLLAPDGRLVIINSMKSRMAEVDLMKLMVKRLTLTGSTLRARDAAFKGAIGEQLEKQIWPKIASGQIKPIIHATFPLEEAAAAHRLLESSSHMGKIVLTVNH